MLQLGSDTETTEMTADIYEREEAIHVDYSNLAKELMVREDLYFNIVHESMFS